MRYLPVLASVLLAGLTLPLGAQESAPAAQAAPAAEGGRRSREAGKPPATPTEEARKRGFFQRLFGSKERPKAVAATPAPAPASTPRRWKRPAKATPAPEPEDKPEEKPSAPAKPEAAPEQPENKPAPEPPKESKRPSKGNKPTPPPVRTKEQAALEKAQAGGDADAIEKAKYNEVKSRAETDPKIHELKEKADNSPTEEEGRKNQRAYNKALFGKMRSLEPDLKPRIDRVEAAVLRQLGGE